MGNKKKVLVLASNLGLWAEELQGPWDALINAGHEITLATERGITPLPLAFSVDPEFVDPQLNLKVNPPEYVCARTRSCWRPGRGTTRSSSPTRRWRTTTRSSPSAARARPSTSAATPRSTNSSSTPGRRASSSAPCATRSVPSSGLATPILARASSGARPSSPHPRPWDFTATCHTRSTTRRPTTQAPTSSRRASCSRCT